MKHLFKNSIIAISLIISFVFVYSCDKEKDNKDKAKVEKPSGTNKTALEGSWLLQNRQSGSELNFSNNNFTLNSGTVTIKGTYTLSGNSFKGIVTSRSGANSEGLSPDTFNGMAEFSKNGSEVTFSNFSGNWSAVFSSWYQKQ